MKLTITLIVTVIFCASILGPASASKRGVDTGEVVEVHTRVRRDGRDVTFKIDDKDYDFKFEPSNRRVYSNDTPIWLVKSKPGSTPNYTYERVLDTENILSNGEFYVDHAKRAIVFAHYDEKIRETRYDGLFGELRRALLIKSLPAESQKGQLQRSRREGNHVIHKTQKIYPHLLSNGLKEKRSRRHSKIDPLEVKLAKPLDVLYPKLLVLVDNSLFQYYNKDIKAIVKYVATFWNAVDQKYAELDTTDVQLLITGIIIADDENAFNFVNMGKLDPTKYGENKYWIDYILQHMANYFYDDFPYDIDFENYDTALLMTALDTLHLTGTSYRSGICDNYDNNIVVKDQGWFGGINDAAHELGHALGARHDKFTMPFSECAARDGLGGVSVMSELAVEGDYNYWSECSKADIQNFTTLAASECLATRHRSRFFPDEFDSSDEQD